MLLQLSLQAAIEDLAADVAVVAVIAIFIPQPIKKQWNTAIKVPPLGFYLIKRSIYVNPNLCLFKFAVLYIIML